LSQFTSFDQIFVQGKKRLFCILRLVWNLVLCEEHLHLSISQLVCWGLKRHKVPTGWSGRDYKIYLKLEMNLQRQSALDVLVPSASLAPEVSELCSSQAGVVLVNKLALSRLSPPTGLNCSMK
jgi:hypothetical protein